MCKESCESFELGDKNAASSPFVLLPRKEKTLFVLAKNHKSQNLSCHKLFLGVLFSLFCFACQSTKEESSGEVLAEKKSFSFKPQKLYRDKAYQYADIEHEDFELKYEQGFLSPELRVQVYQRDGGSSEKYSDKVDRVFAWDFDSDGTVDMIDVVDKEGKLLYTAADFNQNGRIDTFIEHNKKSSLKKKNEKKTSQEKK